MGTINGNKGTAMHRFTPIVAGLLLLGAYLFNLRQVEE